jgi:plastocyanin
MRKILVVLAIVSMVAVGCGNDSNEAAEPTTTSSASGSGGATPVSLSGSVNDHGTTALAGKELEVELDNFYFEPTFVKATAGAKLSVKLKNEGSAEHTFTIDSLGIDEDLQPDAEKTIEITLPSSGTVNYYCRFHRASGMQGAFYFD